MVFMNQSMQMIGLKGKISYENVVSSRVQIDDVKPIGKEVISMWTLYMVTFIFLLLITNEVNV